MKRDAVRLYTAVAGPFLLLQGASTLLFRLVPSLNEAFPALLTITQMQPTHSWLHIISGLLAVGFLLAPWLRGAFWFALGFGLFYLTLGLVGLLTGQPTALHMQAFDHPFHMLLGGWGLVAVVTDLVRQQKRGRIL